MAGWITPTGASGWYSPQLVRDNNEGTSAYMDTDGWQWSPFFVFTHASLYCTKVRFLWSDNTSAARTIDVDIYYSGAWHDLYQGDYTESVWQEKSFGGQWLTQFRIRIYVNKDSQQRTYGWEVDFYEAITIPNAPSGCTAHYVATDNSKCTWNDNSDNETGFRIEVDIDDAGFAFWKNVGANVEDSGNHTTGANKKIRFRVRAYNAAGDSGWSTSGYVYTTPTAPSGCSISLGTINVGWNDNSAHEDGFKIERNLDDAGWALVQTVGADVTSWPDTSQPTGANEKYQYRVRAYKGTLYSAYSTSTAIWAKTFSESIGLTDSFSKIWTIYRTFTESIGLSDAYSRVLSLYRTFTESITLSDTLIKIRGKVFSEVISLSDSLIKKPSKVFSEQITLADSYLRRWTIYRTFTESITLTDSLIKKAFKSFTEILNLSDVYARVVSWYKTFTETLTLAATLRKSLAKTFIESLTIADFLIEEVTRQRANFLQALNADGMFPSGVVRNLQHGLDADKSASPLRGDWYIATDTQKVYICFSDENWTQIYS